MLVKSLIYLILVATSLFIALPLALWLLTRGAFAFSFGMWRSLGSLPLAVGILFTLWSAVYFPIYGKGTPLPSDPPRKLATKGLYKYTRNPMYLGAILTLIGQAVILESPAVLLLAAFMWVLFHLIVVYREERGLRSRFGQSFEEYAKAVPRWLPRIIRKGENKPPRL